MRNLFVTASLLAASVLFAQNTPGPAPAPSEDPEVKARRFAVSWATGVASRFATTSNTVVSAYSLARLGSLTCKYDQNAASGMFRQAASRMGSIPAQIFTDEQTPRLPVASFTGLSRTTMAAAKACDPSLPGVLDTEAFDRRRKEERRYATNSVVAQAMNRYDADPDRAAQLVDFVLEAGDPGAIDFGQVELFLARLRERSPELGDDVFRHALETVVSAPSPGTADLGELGKYLFVDASSWSQPDDRNLSRSVAIGNTTIYDFRRVRMSANPDLVTAYIGALQRMVEQAMTPQFANPMATIRYDGTAAYSIALQVAKHARDLELAAADTITQLLPRIYTNTAAQVEAAIGTLAPDPQSDMAADRNRRVREIFSDIRRGKYDDARREMNGIGDIPTTRQIAPLIDFAEAKNPNLVQPGGVKRAMMYVGAVQKSGDEGFISLGTREAQSLPAEFRAAMLSALAVGIFEAKKPDRGYIALSDTVRALNDARSAPRRARFDPREIRGATGNASGAGSGTDVSAIPFGENRFYQVIDTGTARFNYELNVSGVTTFSLGGAIKHAEALDPQRLESLIQTLRDEAKQADAYLAIAELRFAKIVPIQTR